MLSADSWQFVHDKTLLWQLVHDKILLQAKHTAHSLTRTLLKIPIYWPGAWSSFSWWHASSLVADLEARISAHAQLGVSSRILSLAANTRMNAAWQQDFRHTTPVIAPHVHYAESLIVLNMANERWDMLITSSSHCDDCRPQIYQMHQQQIHLVLVYITESLLLLLWDDSEDTGNRLAHNLAAADIKKGLAWLFT